MIEGLTIRRATQKDRRKILAVCEASLGWKPGDPNADFFSWKHDANHFGRSPMWVAAESSGDVIGIRAFLKWRFREPDGTLIHAVRAVDTATTPGAQGRGVFRALTLGAIPDLREDGVDVVFNTPNEKSRPGYIKMGWNEVGRVPVAVRIRSPFALRSLIGANTPAAMWSYPTDFAESAATAFGDPTATDELLSHAAVNDRITTDSDAGYLAWRYSFGPLDYRVFPLGDNLARGAVVFRVRQRGTATEAAICDIIAPPGVSAARALRAILRGTGADYLVVAQDRATLRNLCVPVPRLGPRLTWRSINRTGTPGLSQLRLSVGDVELF